MKKSQAQLTRKLLLGQASIILFQVLTIFFGGLSISQTMLLETTISIKYQGYIDIIYIIFTVILISKLSQTLFWSTLILIFLQGILVNKVLAVLSIVIRAQSLLQSLAISLGILNVLQCIISFIVIKLLIKQNLEKNAKQRQKLNDQKSLLKEQLNKTQIKLEEAIKNHQEELIQQKQKLNDQKSLLKEQLNKTQIKLEEAIKNHQEELKTIQKQFSNDRNSRNQSINALQVLLQRKSVQIQELSKQTETSNQQYALLRSTLQKALEEKEKQIVAIAQDNKQKNTLIDELKSSLKELEIKKTQSKTQQQQQKVQIPQKNPTLPPKFPPKPKNQKPIQSNNTAITGLLPPPILPPPPPPPLTNLNKFDLPPSPLPPPPPIHSPMNPFIQQRNQHLKMFMQAITGNMMLKSKKSALKPKVQLKGIGWTVINEAEINPSNSFWSSIKQTKQILPKSITQNQIRAQFEKKKKSMTKSEEKTSNKLQFVQKMTKITSDRARNIQIVLKRYKIDADNLPQIVIDFEDDPQYELITPEKINSMMKILPKQQEVKLYADINISIQQKEQWNPADYYLCIASKIPQFDKRIQAINFKFQFDKLKQDTTSKINLLLDQFQDISNDNLLKKFLQYLLKVGNFLNQDSFKGNATGFRLDCIQKTFTLLGQDNKTSLFDFIFQNMSKEQQDQKILIEMVQKYRSRMNLPIINIKQVFDEIRIIKRQIQNMEQCMKNIQEDVPSRFDSKIILQDMAVKYFANFGQRALKQYYELSQKADYLKKYYETIKQYFSEKIQNDKMMQIVIQFRKKVCELTEKKPLMLRIKKPQYQFSKSDIV